jgi:spermidine synthase
LKFIIQSSTYSYASILGTFLVGLGVGGAIYRRWLTGSDHVALIGRLQLALALWVLATVWLLYGLAPSAWFNDALLSPVYEGDHHWSFGVGLFGLVCAVVLVPPTTAMGVSFPALSTLFHRHASESAGRCVCAVFASNTIGSIAGALVVGFGLLPWLGIRGSLVLMAAL